MADVIPLKKWPGGIGEMQPGDALLATGAINEGLPVALASAATMAIGAATANTINVTGTTTITAFDSIEAGAKRTLIFGGALTLTHHAVSMILPGGANIPVAAGDVAEFESLGGGNWRCTDYTKANGRSVIGGDLLSQLIGAEVSVTGATTLTSSAFGKMHVCSGTSADYTVGLPAVSGNSGKLIGIRGDSALTRYVTLDPNASETIDSAASKVLRADEVMLLYCTGAAWTVLSFKSYPIKFSVTKTANQSIAPGVFTKVTFNNTEYNDGGGFDLANSRFVCPRAGTYHLAGNVTMNLTGTGDSQSFRIYKNGAQVRYPTYTTTANTPTFVAASGATTLQLVVGDVVELYVYLAAAANRDITGNTLGATVFSMTEVLQ